MIGLGIGLFFAFQPEALTITVNPAEPITGDEITFVAETDSEVDEWMWKFGDDIRAFKRKVKHKYEETAEPFKETAEPFKDLNVSVIAVVEQNIEPGFIQEIFAEVFVFLPKIIARRFGSCLHMIGRVENRSFGEKTYSSLKMNLNQIS